MIEWNQHSDLIGGTICSATIGGIVRVYASRKKDSDAWELFLCGSKDYKLTAKPTEFDTAKTLLLKWAVRRLKEALSEVEHDLTPKTPQNAE
jgi:hypothetical protein